MRTSWAFCMVLLLVSGCAGIAARDKVESFQELQANPAKFAGQRIIVSGFLQEDALGNILLYVSRRDADNKNYANEIDIVSGKRTESGGRDPRTQCASVVGKFLPFDNGTIGMGFLRSQTGLVEAERITWHPCNQQNDPT